MRVRNVLPSILTMCNASAGFASIVFTLNSEFSTAATLLFLAILFDGLDGRVARMLNNTSDFGVELDSLADIISFGVAPALLMYSAYLKEFGWIGILVSAMLIVCGMIRLARFNLYSKLGHFIGLPIPAAGVFLATIVLSDLQIQPKHLVIWMLLLSYLMISRIKYPTFKRKMFGQMVKSKNFILFILFFALLAAMVTVIDPNKLLVLPFLYYILAGPILELKSYSRHKN